MEEERVKQDFPYKDRTFAKLAKRGQLATIPDVVPIININSNNDNYYIIMHF